jgi:hypothetical protein
LETQKLLTAAFALASFASKSSAAKPLIFELSAATDLGSASLLVPPLAECRTYAPLIAGVRLLRFASKRIVAVGLGLLLAAGAHAAGYRFTKLAETDGTILQVSLPAINQLGVVTYRHVTATRQVIVTNNGGVLTTIVQSGEPVSFLNPPQSVNDAGAVPFYVQTNNNTRTAIWSGSGGATTIVAQPGTATPIGLVSGIPGSFASINNSGNIAFIAFLTSPSRIAQLVRKPDASFLAIADSSGPLFGMSAMPIIDDNGNVYFTASSDDRVTLGMYTGDGGALITLLDTQGGAFTDLQSMNANNTGGVAFIGRPSGGSLGVFTLKGGLVTAVADTSGPYTGMSHTPDINDNGTVAFHATLATGGEGVFTGPDPVADRVIAPGDDLFGSRLVRAFFHNGINNRGQIAFYAELEDGRQVIALADRVDATPTGKDIVVTPTDPSPVTGNTTPVTLSFSTVTSGGTTTVTTSGTGTPPPESLKLGSPPVYYEISTTAQHSGPITICIHYSGISYGNEAALKLMHQENGTWVDITTSRDPVNDIICGVVQSLSPFAVFEPAPYPFTGFFPPVAGLPGATASKAGASLPVKFSLGRDRGLDIFRAGYPKSQEVACGSWSASDSLEDTGTAGASGLRYDAAAGQYVYVWKTESSWRATCRQFDLGLRDDSSHVFVVQFPNK